MVLIKLPLLQKFRHLSLTMPGTLPKRRVLLTKTYSDYEQKIKHVLQSEKQVDVPLGPTIDGVPVRQFDINNENHFKEMTRFVEQTTTGLLSDDPYDRILLSKQSSCCDKSLRAVFPGTIARLYTTTGTKSCLVLKSSCSTCAREFWPGYEQRKRGDYFDRIYSPDENAEFFCSTRNSVFEIKYLKQVTATSEAGGLPFVDHADIYNISQQIDEDWRRMDRRQLLVAFLLWNISWRLPGVPLKCRMTKREFDSEFFCINAYPVLRAKYKTWTKHKCQNKLKGNKKKRDDDDESQKKQDDDTVNQPKKLKISKTEPRSSNIRGSKEVTSDTGANRCRMCKQPMDSEDTLIYTGHPSGAMQENVGLSDVQDKNEISEKQFSVRLNNCAIYDENQHIIPYSIDNFFIKFINNLIDKKSDLFFSGFIEKSGESEIQEGVPIYDCGPIIRCWSDTYVGCDRPSLVLKTPLAEYYAINSSPMYAPLMTKGN